MKTAHDLFTELMDAIDAAGLSQGEVFREAGISTAQLTRWRREDHEPRLSNLRALADAAKLVARRHGKALGELPTLDSLL